MKKILWRVVFCVIVFDCLSWSKCKSLFGRVIDESRYRYKPYLNANDMASRFLAEVNK